MRLGVILLFLFFVQAALTGTSFAGRTCNPSDTLRSVWGKKNLALKKYKDLWDLPLKKLEGINTTAYPDSIGFHSRQTLLETNDIDRTILSFETYMDDFKNTFDRDPVPKDMKLYLESRSSSMLKFIDRRISEMKKSRNPDAEGLLKGVQKLKKRVAWIQKEPGNLKLIESKFSRLVGVMGELRAYVQLPNLKGVSVQLSDIPQMKSAIYDLDRKLMGLASRDKKALRKLQEKYPTLFKNAGIDFYNTPDAKLKSKIVELRHLLLDTEIDAVRFSDHQRLKLVETKYSRNTMDFNTKNLSIWEKETRDGLMRLKEILRITETENIADVEFLNIRGYTDHALQELTPLGIKLW